MIFEIIAEFRTVNAYCPFTLPSLNKWELLLAAIVVAYGIGLLYLMFFHGHTMELQPPSQMVVDPFEWSVPVGSPEIGIRPDGTVGSLNEFGRISLV